MKTGFQKQFARWVTQGVFCIVVVCVFSQLAEACPTCKESLSQNDAQMVRGYFWSIMFMMAMPFSILTAMSTYFYMLIRKARKLKAADLSQAEEPA